MAQKLKAETQAKIAEQQQLEDQLLAVFAKLQLLNHELLARPTLTEESRETLENLQRETLKTMKQIAAGVAAEIAELERNLGDVPPAA
jgi:hypothetical protein